jgi:GNAT superfamily N-acetyltransferase
MTKIQNVITYHLEITDPSLLRPVQRQIAELDVRQARIPMPELNRFLYATVGGDWHWRDRLMWDYERWMQYLDRPELETWVAYLEGTPAAYFELEKQPGDNAEIVYFGVMPQFIGRGLGGLMLTRAIERGWQWGARRVWVHTCTLDHPTALQHYQARGMQVFKTEEKLVHLSDEPGESWPGANRSTSVSTSA